jgi:hypothetical protein
MPFVIAGGGGGATGPTGPAGAAGLPIVWTSATESSAHGSGVWYLPLRKNITSSIRTEFIAPAARTFSPSFRYSPSSSGGGNIVLQVKWRQWADGDSTSAALTVGSLRTIAVPADVLSHRITVSDVPELSWTLAAGDGLYVEIFRVGGGSDNFDGDIQIEVAG